MFIILPLQMLQTISVHISACQRGDWEMILFKLHNRNIHMILLTGARMLCINYALKMRRFFIQTISYRNELNGPCLYVSLDFAIKLDICE